MADPARTTNGPARGPSSPPAPTLRAHRREAAISLWRGRRITVTALLACGGSPLLCVDRGRELRDRRTPALRRIHPTCPQIRAIPCPASGVARSADPNPHKYLRTDGCALTTPTCRAEPHGPGPAAWRARRNGHPG